MTISIDSDGPTASDLAHDPYAFFAHKRRTEPVWRGTIMDKAMAPPELVADEEWKLFDFF